MSYIAWVLEVKIRERWIPSLLIFAGMLVQSNYVENFAAMNDLSVDEVRLIRVRQRAPFIRILGHFNPENYVPALRSRVIKLVLWASPPEDGDSVRLDDSLFTKHGGQFMEVAI